MAGAFYNEHDPKAAAWLRELIAQGHIAPGVVDERSISDIAPDELAGFTQCHFFAGIGVWPLALRAARWPDERPIWTGSCPCQPFSAAGKGDGFADERHLWPQWHWLIEQRRPAIVLGEQVASKDALVWLDLVSTDLEAAGYAFGAADLCAAGAGLEAFSKSVWGERLSRAIHLCPDPVVAGALRDFADFAGRHLGGEHGGHHIRQRAYFVGLADVAVGRFGEFGDALGARHGGHADRGGDASGRVAHALDDGHRKLGIGLGGATGEGESRSGERKRVWPDPADGGATDRMANRERIERVGRRSGEGEQPGLERHGRDGDDWHEPGRFAPQPNRSTAPAGGAGNAHAPNRSRGDADWLFCRDGKWRAVEPCTFPLAHAAPARVGRLRGYGNALDLETAVLWIETVMAHLSAREGERVAA